MKENVKSVIKFIIRQEKKLFSIVQNIEDKELTVIEKNVFRDLLRTTEKNITLLERDYYGLADKIKKLPITNLLLDDFNIDVPNKKKFNYQTNLIFIMKIIDNCSQLLSFVIRKCNDNVLKKMLEDLINEKVQLKQRIESIYNKIIT